MAHLSGAVALHSPLAHLSIPPVVGMLFFVPLLSNAAVSAALRVSLEDVECLGDELGVFDDAWTEADVEAAQELLEDELDEEDDSDDPELDSEDDDEDETDEIDDEDFEDEIE